MDNNELIKKLNIEINLNEKYRLIHELISNKVLLKEIVDKSKYPIYKIINYILAYGDNNIDDKNAIEEYYNNLKIDNKKCLIIADNHLGRLDTNESINKSCYENERGLYFAYNHALKNNIKEIIHLGDLLEGNSDPGQRRLETTQKQLDYLERIYPKIDNIKTYLLYGNHDYNLIHYENIDQNFYKLCKNMELIGVNYSFINFCGNRIKLSHDCSASSYLKNLDLPYCFEIAGHSHIFVTYDGLRLVKAPSLSSVSANKDFIGYLEMIDEENEFVFKFFDYNGNEITKEEEIITKTLYLY